jgi:hypothetical protein
VDNGVGEAGDFGKNDARCSIMDTDIGTELFAGYENDFNLIIADISSKLQDLQDKDGESRKAAVRAAERAVEEAEEIVQLTPLGMAHNTCR